MAADGSADDLTGEEVLRIDIGAQDRFAELAVEDLSFDKPERLLEGSITGHEKRSDYLEIMVAGIEDADMAEAATRFQQAQTAVQVSAQTFSRLSQISLLNYL